MCLPALLSRLEVRTVQQTGPFASRFQYLLTGSLIHISASFSPFFLLSPLFILCVYVRVEPYQLCLSFRDCTSWVCYFTKKNEAMCQIHRQVPEKREKQRKHISRAIYYIIPGTTPGCSFTNSLASYDEFGWCSSCCWLSHHAPVGLLVNIYSPGTIVPLEQDHCSSSIFLGEKWSLCSGWNGLHGMIFLNWESAGAVNLPQRSHHGCCPHGKMTWCMWGCDIQTNYLFIQFTSFLLSAPKPDDL